MSSLFEPEVKIGAHPVGVLVNAGAVTWKQEMAYDADIGTVYIHASGNVGHLLVTDVTLNQNDSKASKGTILISGIATATAGGVCTEGTQVFVIPASGLLTSTSTGNKELVGARFVTTAETSEVVQIAQ